jgi:hypothetical protein
MLRSAHAVRGQQPRGAHQLPRWQRQSGRSSGADAPLDSEQHVGAHADGVAQLLLALQPRAVIAAERLAKHTRAP